MVNTIESWLTKQGIADTYLSQLSALIGVVAMLIICSLSYYLFKTQLLAIVKKIIIRSKNEWDDLLLNHDVFTQVALLVPLIILLFLTSYFLDADSQLAHFIAVFAKVGMAIQVARTLGSLLNVTNSIYHIASSKRDLPINATIQLIKLAIYLVAIILSISIVIGESPIYLLSGLGALTAVLLLVFQDTIKGLVASIQISANRMVSPGDWIEMTQYGADGDVIEIGLNTVKVQNWDKTVTTIPTYALISESFKNWRGMVQSGGRRVKRSIIIDLRSIQFLSGEKLESLQRFILISDYITKKKEEIATARASLNLADDDIFNARRMTNIGTFRAYIGAYLKQHDKVHKGMTCMVRQLPATEHGLPLELYFFSNDQNWINYEAIVADIFDHLLATAPLFDLRVFQSPTGFDWQNREH